MHKYFVAVRNISTRDFKRFKVEANNKHEAIEKARFVLTGQYEVKYGTGYDLENIICVRKIQID